MNGDTPGDPGDEGGDRATESRDREDADDATITRRRLVASGAATWASVSLAGCNYITDPGPPDEGGDGGDGGDDPTPTVTTTTTTTDSPPATPTDDGTPGGTDDGGDDTPTETPSPTPTATPTATPTESCDSIGRFFPGMEVGLHVSIYDPETGEALGGDAIDSVTVEFPGADFGPLELNWEGPHEAFSRDSWGSKVVTDDDAEPGTYEYHVSVNGGEADVEGTISDQFTIV